MASSNTSVCQAIIVMVAVLCVASAPYCEAARGLKQREAYNNARIIKPSASTPSSARTALTPTDAESSANAAFGGVHRLTAPPARRSYATVDAHTTEVNSKNRVTTPRARSAQDIPRGGPNRGNGANSMPALVMGGIAMAQTYEGATAVATTDSLALNRGGRRGVAISASRMTTRVGTLRGASRTGSFGVTSSQGVGSKALSGNANGQIVLAQAHDAVALSQAERGP